MRKLRTSEDGRIAAGVAIYTAESTRYGRGLPLGPWPEAKRVELLLRDLFDYCDAHQVNLTEAFEAAEARYFAEVVAPADELAHDLLESEVDRV